MNTARKAIGAILALGFAYFLLRGAYLFWVALEVPSRYVFAVAGVSLWTIFLRQLATRPVVKLNWFTLCVALGGYALIIFAGWHGGDWESVKRVPCFTCHEEYAPSGSDGGTLLLLCAATIFATLAGIKIVKEIRRKPNKDEYHFGMDTRNDNIHQDVP
jgi:hypothetical protein